jgi:hypothetical protein
MDGSVGISAISHDANDARYPWCITVRAWTAARPGWRWLVDNVPHERWSYTAGRNRFGFESQEDAVMFYFVCLGGEDGG